MKKLMPNVLMLIVLIAMFATSHGSQALPDGDAISRSLAVDASDNLSYNNSTIVSKEENSLSYAPTKMSVGTGYYSSQPVSYGSQFGGSVQIRNLRTGTSMKRDLNYANAVNGAIDIAAEDSSYRRNDQEWDSTSTTQMNVDEEVTDGRVHIGVLQGSQESSPDKGASSILDSMTTAWKDPEIEIDEDYVGTYHIEKNMTIEVPYRRVLRAPDWLSCCSTYFDRDNFGLSSVGADDVFNCNLVGH